jgi:hypothetical protein
MSKYDPLKFYLIQSQEKIIQLSFAQIERILDEPLPNSAFRYSAWWANEVEGNHSHSNSWMDAGYKTENLDLNTKRVTFQKVG